VAYRLLARGAMEGPGPDRGGSTVRTPEASQGAAAVVRAGGRAMTARLIQLVAGVLTVLVVAAPAAWPQTAPPVAVLGAPPFTPAQLDQMLAPIALYPDPLLAQILMAATYPLEVVQASRWRQDPTISGLTGDDLAAALGPLRWDPSVKSLVPFPQILQMLDRHLDWMEAIGDAFLAQEADVMDAVQRLRQRAQATGTLTSTPEQMVLTQEQAVSIVPADPQVVYVPAYDPGVVYGPWPYPAYPPVLLEPPPAVVVGAPVVVFGFGVGVVRPLWGWHRWDWHRHRVEIDGPRFHAIDPYRPRPWTDGWQHDPGHRRGVPYRDVPTRDRYRFGPASTPDARRDYRGYAPAPAPVVAPAPASPGRLAPAPGPSRVAPAPAPVSPGRPAPPPPPAPASPAPSRVAPAPAPSIVSPGRLAPAGAPSRPSAGHVAPPAAPARPVAPAFESLGRGGDARVESDRGRSSLGPIAPAPAAKGSAPAVIAPHSPAAASGTQQPGTSKPRR
jgi:Protein of unknown function (DUF3300)